MAIDAVIGKRCNFLTILLEALGARSAMLAGIDHAPNADRITSLECRNSGTNACDATDDFVSGYDGILRTTPIVSSRVQIGMTHAAKEGLDHHIVGAWRPTVKAKRDEIIFR